ncbi:Arm DNA-binding domain-containing protein [Myroides odoratimimus]|nr:Arm DNA-binding domain-containing protein [Myroides odoratimimus]
MKTSLKIVLKKTKLSDGTYPINLRVTINRRSKFYKTPYSTAPKFWNAKVGEFTSKFPNFLQANRILSTLKQDASKVLDLMIEQEKEFTLEVFDSLLRPEKVCFNPRYPRVF